MFSTSSFPYSFTHERYFPKRVLRCAFVILKLSVYLRFHSFYPRIFFPKKACRLKSRQVHGSAECDKLTKRWNTSFFCFMRHRDRSQGYTLECTCMIITCLKKKVKVGFLFLWVILATSKYQLRKNKQIEMKEVAKKIKFLISYPRRRKRKCALEWYFTAAILFCVKIKNHFIDKKCLVLNEAVFAMIWRSMKWLRWNGIRWNVRSQLKIIVAMCRRLHPKSRSSFPSSKA